MTEQTWLERRREMQEAAAKDKEAERYDKEMEEYEILQSEADEMTEELNRVFDKGESDAENVVPE